MTVALWRIATEAPEYSACDPSGAGAKRTGGRWNRAGIPMVYAAPSLALAALETIVHLDAGGFPVNRYVVRIDVPLGIWSRRMAIDEGDAPGGWDAIPAGQTSISFGNDWAAEAKSALLLVPSIVVPMEQNVLINPCHPDAAAFLFTTVRRFNFDTRLVRAGVLV